MSQAGSFGSGGVTPTPFEPNKLIQDFDDFIDANGSDIGKFSWVAVSSAFAINGTSTNPGIMEIILQNPGNSFYIQYNNNVGAFVLGAGTFASNIVYNVAALSTNSNTYKVLIGLFDQTSLGTPASPVNGAYFSYTNSVNSGNWQINTTSASTSTTANTTTTAAIGFHNYGISVNAAGTSVSFTIDGASVTNSPLSTHIPTTALIPGVIILVTNGTPVDQFIDLWYYSQNLTIAR